jgi:hypothetical protein
VPPTITHATNHIRNGLSGGFFSGLLVRMDEPAPRDRTWDLPLTRRVL